MAVDSGTGRGKESSAGQEALQKSLPARWLLPCNPSSPCCTAVPTWFGGSVLCYIASVGLSEPTKMTGTHLPFNYLAHSPGQKGLKNVVLIYPIANSHFQTEAEAELSKQTPMSSALPSTPVSWGL